MVVVATLQQILRFVSCFELNNTVSGFSRLFFMGNEASIAAGALQAKAKMSQALDSVDQSFKSPPVAKNNKDFTKVHQDRERE